MARDHIDPMIIFIVKSVRDQIFMFDGAVWPGQSSFRKLGAIEIMRVIFGALAACMVLASSAPSIAKDKEKTFVVVNEAVGVPVFPDDITDRPYDVVGEVKAGVRKATIFSNEASQVKIYKELWERAEKLGADAVINAKYGDSHVTALSWGSTSATGTAIKFKSTDTAAVPAK